MNRHHAWLFLSGAVAALLFSSLAAAADPAPLELLQTITLKGKAGKLDHLGLDAKRERLFLANKINNTLDVVDLKTGKLLQQVANQSGVQGIAFAPELDRLFVALGTGGFCNVFNGEDYKLQKTIKFADDADNARYNPKTNLVYVAHAEKALGVIDARTLELKTDIKLPGGAEGIELETGRPRLYLNVPPSLVVVIDTDKNEVVNKYSLKLAAQNNPLALDEPNHRLFLGCKKSPMVVVMDTESGKEIASVPIPGDIDDLVFDAKRKRLYALCGEGAIAVIRQVDADHYEALAKVPTDKGARTGYFDANTGKLYLGVPRAPESKEGPFIKVYQAKP